MLTTPAPATPVIPAPGTSPGALSAERSALADRPLVLAWSRAHGLRPDSCADIAQEVFLRLVATRPSFPSRAAQVAWLRRVTSNLCVDALRVRKPLMLVDDRPGPASPDAITPDEQRALADAVRELTEMQRLVLIGKAVEEATFATLAADLDISIPTAKTHYRRAIDALRLRMHATPQEPNS